MPSLLITRLYDLADELYRRAPWQWLEEIQLIALRHPQTGEVGYLSVMGREGSHRALAVYLGQEAIERFNRIHSDDPGTEQDAMRLILESRQLQLSFNERAILTKEDLAEIKTLGRKYRGETWPQMRSFHPGVVADRITEEEAVWLTLAVEQLFIVAPRLKSDPDQTFRQMGQEPQILCRSQSAEGVWADEWIPHHTKLHSFPQPDCDTALAARVKALPDKRKIECLFMLLPSRIGPKGGRCVYPYIILAVDADSGFILGVELTSMEKRTFEELIAEVPNTFLRLFERAGICPKKLDCASLATAHLLHQPAKQLGVKVQCYEGLPLLDEIVAKMPL